MYIERVPVLKFEHIISESATLPYIYAFDGKNIVPEKPLKIIILISPRSSGFRRHHRKYVDREGLGRSRSILRNLLTWRLPLSKSIFWERFISNRLWTGNGLLLCFREPAKTELIKTGMLNVF